MDWFRCFCDATSKVGQSLGFQACTFKKLLNLVPVLKELIYNSFAIFENLMPVLKELIINSIARFLQGKVMNEREDLKANRKVTPYSRKRQGFKQLLSEDR